MDYFAANDLAPFSVLSGVPTETTNGSFIDVAYTPQGIFPNGASIQSPPFINPDTGATVSLTSLWFHMNHFTANNGGLTELVKFVDSAGTPVVRLVTTTNVTYRADYWNGSAWIAGPTTYNTAGARMDIDMHIVGGAGGTIDVYFNNSLQLSVTGLTASVDNFQSLILGGPGNYTFSQLLVSDVNTIGAKVASLVPNANSATNTAWANDWNNIKKTGFNDATMISSSTTGDNESYGATDATLPTAQYTVSSVWFAVRARLNSGAGGVHFKPLLRIGATNYVGGYNFGGNLNNVSFAGAIAGFSKDPSTAANWNGVTNINAAEWGFQTAA